MNAVTEAQKQHCYHCGEECKDNSVHSDDRVFCCTGCSTVYSILNDNALCDYYSLVKAPGNKVNEQHQNYAYLKEENIINELVSFNEGNISGVTFYIPDIHCSSCIWLLENLYKVNSGIINSFISFQKKEIEIRFNKQTISLDQIASLLASLGYPPQITLNGKLVTKKSTDRSLFYKIGIAGFCFGNIMLLSIPDYVSFFDDFNESFRIFFSFISFILALPVFFYCASDYFISAWNALKLRTINIDLPIALGLLAAFSQSIMEITSGSGMGYLDSLTGLVFFLLIGKWYQRKTYEAMSFQRDYKSYFPLAASIIKNDEQQFVPLKELCPGDVVFLRNQDLIPADGILLEGTASIDYSFVTGESLPISKSAGDLLFAGGRQNGASIKIRLTKKVSESYLTQLWNREGKTEKRKSGLIRFTDNVGKYFTIAVILIALITYLYWQFMNPSIALHSAISVLIIFCPCTLALAIPFCFGNAMNILGRNAVFLKNTDTIEKLAETEVIILDKTGTLTSIENPDIQMEGQLSEAEYRYVKSLVKQSSHPLNKLLYQSLIGVNEYPVSLYHEELSRGITAFVDGHKIKAGSAVFTGFDQKSEQPAGSSMYISINDTIKAVFIFKNKYRKGIFKVIKDLSKKYATHLLSGDNASELKTLMPYFDQNRIHFNQSPVNKMSYVQELSQRNKTLMIGDGLNDAGALMAGNCGISVSESNSNFTPACDVIMDANELIKLPDILSYSRMCVKTVQLSLLISLSYNLIGLIYACQGRLKPLIAAILMPLSSVSIVLFVTMMSYLLAKKYRLNKKANY